MGFRYSNGTQQNVHYMFTTDSLMNGRYLLGFPNDDPFSEEFVKQVNLSLDKDIYGKYIKAVNNPVLRVSKYRENDFGNLEKTYYFLYGKPIECICPKTEEEAELEEFEKPIPWTEEKVQNMDWDSFLIALYTVLCSNCSFQWPEAWDIILSIISYFPYFSDDEWERLLFGRNVDIYDDCRCSFSEELANMLEMKVLSYLTEDNCFDACKGLLSLKNAPIDYDKLEKKCCDEFKKIALKRIEEARVSMDYKSEEIVKFEPEDIFFFKLLFELDNSNDAKREIYSKLSDIFSMAGTFALLEGNEEISEQIYDIYEKYQSLAYQFQNADIKKEQQISIFDTVEDNDFEAANNAVIAMFEDDLISNTKKSIAIKAMLMTQILDLFLKNLYF